METTLFSLQNLECLHVKSFTNVTNNCCCRVRKDIMSRIIHDVWCIIRWSILDARKWDGHRKSPDFVPAENCKALTVFCRYEIWGFSLTIRFSCFISINFKLALNFVGTARHVRTPLLLQKYSRSGCGFDFKNDIKIASKIRDFSISLYSKFYLISSTFMRRLL